MIAVLCGGVGAARFLAGLQQVVEPDEIVAIVNTGDDTELHGLHVSPDLDTITYTLAGAVNASTGWGLEGETFRAMEALDRYGGITWFRLGDADLATHLYRTSRLAEGASLSEVTGEIAIAWGLGLRLLPMSDDPVRTRLRLAAGDEVEFQEYFVKLRHAVAVSGVRFAGAATATPAPGVLAAIETADLVIVAPSNPVVSIGPILAVPGVAERLAARRSTVVAISPIVGGAALKGPADRLLVELGGEASAAGVARWLAPHVGTLVVDDVDAASAPDVESAGAACVVVPTVMHTPAVAAELARQVLAAGRAGRPGRGVRGPMGIGSSITVLGVTGIGEVTEGDGLGAVIAAAVELADGDVVVVTQKVVSKAEGRVVEVDASDPAARQAFAESEAVRVLRRRGELVVTETRHGFVCANSGVDLSNVAEGYAVLLPVDPDRSARRIRDGLRARPASRSGSSSRTPSAGPGGAGSPTWRSAAPGSCRSPTFAGRPTRTAASSSRPRSASSTSSPPPPSS